MSALSDRRLARVGQSVPAITVDRRLARAVVATSLIGGYVALGVAFTLSAEGYLLAGIPITVAFQLLVVRQPLRALWLRAMPVMTFTPRSVAAVVVIAIAPATVALGGVRAGDAILVAYGLAGMLGAVGAVYAIRAMDRDAVRATIRATLVTSAVLVGIMVTYRIATGGLNGNVATAIVTAMVSVATYLPVVFVLEEVLFRGLLDAYLHGSKPGADRSSALYGSAMWGIWHLPVMSVALGAFTIPYLVAVHTVLGYVLVTSWRRTGNLAAPGIAHAVSDALRNAVAVL
jgi:membrane protease YdiL (CAAX protease family)